MIDDESLRLTCFDEVESPHRLGAPFPVILEALAPPPQTIEKPVTYSNEQASSSGGLPGCSKPSKFRFVISPRELHWRIRGAYRPLRRWGLSSQCGNFSIVRQALRAKAPDQLARLVEKLLGCSVTGLQSKYLVQRRRTRDFLRTASTSLLMRCGTPSITFLYQAGCRASGELDKTRCKINDGIE